MGRKEFELAEKFRNYMTRLRLLIRFKLDHASAAMLQHLDPYLDHKVRVLQCVAVCCSVLRCVAVCCSVLQCVVVRCSMMQCDAVC